MDVPIDVCMFIASPFAQTIHHNLSISTLAFNFESHHIFQPCVEKFTARPRIC